MNVLATEIQSHLTGPDLSPDQLFDAVSSLHRRVKGSYAAIALISGRGLLAFRDPFGIRPLILGRRIAKNGKDEWIVASESLVIENSGYEIVRDVEPGEAIFIDFDFNLHQRQCAQSSQLIPCAFEYVYLARPDSVMNGISVYETRLRMGDLLAKTISDFVISQGGFLSYDDLKNHKSEWIDPVSTNYRGYDVWELPPNGQGIAALQILNLLEAYDIKSMGFGSAEYIHHFVEAKKIAFADRAKYYAAVSYTHLTLPTKA